MKCVSKEDYILHSKLSCLEKNALIISHHSLNHGNNNFHIIIIQLTNSNTQLMLYLNNYIIQ